MKTHVIRGLIKKDWYCLRSYLMKQIGLLTGMYLIIGFVMKSMSMLPAMLILGVTMSLTTAFSLDETSNWNAYALTMNVTPRQLVAEKYVLFYSAMLGIGLGASLIAGVLDALLFADSDSHAEMLMIGMGGGVAVMLIYALVTAIDIPLFFKMGIEKSRLPMTLTFVIPFVIIFPTAQYWGPLLEDAFDAMSLPVLVGAIGGGLVVVIALAVLISYRVSVSIMEKKEF